MMKKKPQHATALEEGILICVMRDGMNLSVPGSIRKVLMRESGFSQTAHAVHWDLFPAPVTRSGWNLHIGVNKLMLTVPGESRAGSGHLTKPMTVQGQNCLYLKYVEMKGAVSVK